MNISIPERLKAYVEARVAEGDFSSSSDYLRDLVRQDQRYQEAMRNLQAELDKGRASGISRRNLAQIIEETHKDLAARDAA